MKKEILFRPHHYQPPITLRCHSKSEAQYREKLFYIRGVHQYKEEPINKLKFE